MQDFPKDHAELFKALYLVKGDKKKRQEFRDAFVKIYGYNQNNIGIGIVSRDMYDKTIFYLCNKNAPHFWVL
jgi:hypothetical protein